MGGFVPQISQIYTDFLHHDFSSSDFTDESEDILAYRITHGISQNFGRWPMARALYMLLFFCHADFADDADFSSWEGFCPTDFTDIHRFFMESLLNLFVQSQGGYLQRPDRSPPRKSVSNRLSRKSPNKFREIR